MPPRRRAVPAPPPLDLAALRERLSAGSIVRVGLAPSAQFPEGGSGRVRAIGDPETDGEEFIQVEVTVNGARDVLPFAPGDLRPVTRAPRSARQAPDLIALPGIGPERAAPEPRPARTGSAAAHLASRSGLDGDARTGLGSAGASHTMFFEAQESEAEEAGGDTPVLPLTVAAADGAVRVDAPAAAPTPSGPAKRRSTRRPAAEPAEAAVSPVVDLSAPLRAVPVDAAADEPAAAPRSRGRGTRPTRTSAAGTAAAALGTAGATGVGAPRRGGRLPAVSITVSTTPEEPTQWRVDAKVGAKAVVRSEAVSATRVWEMVESMQTPALTAAVGALLDEHRRLTQARAEALAAELAGVQAELASLPAAPER